MDDNDVVARILRGTRPGENSLDVLQMCLIAATAQLAVEAAPVSAPRFYFVLGRMGQILCPIFTPVKPKLYVENMREARLAYKGIASSPALQSSFAELSRNLAASGLLRSTRAAVAGELWSRISPSTL